MRLRWEERGNVSWMQVGRPLPTHLLPPCEEKARLRDAYQRAVYEHTIAVNESLRARGRVSAEEHDRIRTLATEAKSRRDLARLALQQHKREHGC